MQKRALRLLAFGMALACAANAEAASHGVKKKHKAVRQLAGPALATGVAKPGPSQGAASSVTPGTIATYRNALDQTVYAIAASHFDVSKPLRETQEAPSLARGELESPTNPGLPDFRQIQSDVADPVVSAAIPPLQSAAVSTTGPVSGFAFGGIPNTIYWPPDPNGSVGNDQFVETVNIRFAVWSLNRATKVATPIYGSYNLNTLWVGFGGPCQDQNSGDPIVVFDKVAKRWLISQLTSTAYNGAYYECVALSTTADATGSYYRWAFVVPGAWVGDYPHYGVWTDAYTMMGHGFAVVGDGSLTFAAGLFAALDRTKMLAGDPAATWQVIVDPQEAGHMPADLDGFAPPPTNAPAVFVSVHADKMFIYRMKVDFATPANTVRTLQATVPIAPWTGACPTGFCIPQPGDGTPLTAVGDRLMFRAAYRNFVDHESLVVSHSVDPGVTGVVSGIRWYDVRLSGPPDAACPHYPCLHQQGTLADAANGRSRWMPSLAMDAGENMLLGYSVSGKVSGTENHTMRTTGRAKDDSPGTMPVPETIATTGYANSGSPRWGDYISMSVDPFDDCTFFYVNQYVPDPQHWATWIVSSAWPPGSGPGQCPAASCTDRPAAAATLVSAAAVGDNRIDVSWTGIAPTPGAYAIERAEGACGSEGLYRPLAATSGTAGNFTDTTVQGGVHYSYRVIAALDASGRCQALVASACTSATAAGTCHLAPTFAGAATAEGGTAATCGIHLSWTPAASTCPLTPAMRYSVFRGTAPDFAPSAANRIGTCLDAPYGFLDTNNLQNGATYHYVVRAEDGSSGNGGPCGGNLDANDVRVHATAYGSGTQAVSGTWTDGGGDGTALLNLGIAAGPSGTPAWRYVKTGDDPGANHTPGGSFAYRNAGPNAGATYSRYTCAAVTTPPLIAAGTTMNLTYWERHQLQYHWDGVTVEYTVNDSGEWSTVPGPTNLPKWGCTAADATNDWEQLSCTVPTANACGFAASQYAYTGPYGVGLSCADWSSAGPTSSYAHRCQRIASLTPGDAVSIRWRFSSDLPTQRSGFWLDDIAVSNVRLPNTCTPDYSCSGQPPPGDVGGLLADGHAATTLTWTAEPGAGSYDVVSSTLSDLQLYGTSTGSCLASDLTAASLLDSRPDPPSGDGYYYLVRAQDACGRGTYGSTSAGAPRATACP